MSIGFCGVIAPWPTLNTQRTDKAEGAVAKENSKYNNPKFVGPIDRSCVGCCSKERCSNTFCNAYPPSHL